MTPLNAGPQGLNRGVGHGQAVPEAEHVRVLIAFGLAIHDPDLAEDERLAGIGAADLAQLLAGVEFEQPAVDLLAEHVPVLVVDPGQTAQIRIAQGPRRQVAVAVRGGDADALVEPAAA